MTTYGATSYYISISSTKAGTSPTSYPTGDIILLYAESYENIRENKDKIKQMANNNSYANRMGKIAREVNLTRCVIMDDDGNQTTNTASINTKANLLDSWCALGGAPVYVIICPLVDNPGFTQPNTSRAVNFCLTRNGTAAQDFMKGTVTRLRIVAEGNVYMLDINLKETSLY